MKFIILLFFFTCISCNRFFFPNTIPENYTNCKTNQIITINKAFAMDAPTRGQNVTFILLGNVTSIVQMKETKLVVFLAGFQVATFDYPDSSVFSPGQTCEFKYVQYIPTYLPDGKYTLHFEFMDISGSEDGCIELTYHLG